MGISLLKNSLVKRLMGGGFRRNVIQVVGGTAFAQGLLVLFSPILTRIYDPAAFGEFTFFFAITTAILVIGSLRYEFAIPVTPDEPKAERLVTLCLMISAVVSLLSVGLIATVSYFTNGLKGLDSVRLIIACGLALFAMSVQQVLVYWFIRTQNFKRMAISRCAQSIGTIAGQIGLGLAWKSAEGLIYGYLLGVICGAMTAISGYPLMKLKGSFADLRVVAKEFKEFPLFSGSTAAIAAASNQSPFFVVAGFFGANATGWFGLAMRVVLAPVSLFAQAVGQVFYSRAPRAHAENNLGGLVFEVSSRLLAIGLPLTIVFYFAGPDLFALIFGPDWREAGMLARYLAPWALITFLTGPLTKIPAVIGRQREDFNYQSLVFCTRLTFLGLGVYFRDLHLAVILFAVGSSLMTLGYMGWLLRTVGAARRTSLRALQTLGIGVFCVLPFLAAQRFFPENRILLVLNCALALFIGVCYYWIGYQSKRIEAFRIGH